jgi:LuxR family maltose regulon positive regulatory protein
VLAANLINDLHRIEEPLNLVLDDLHLIRERPVFELLAEVLNHPPDNLHLVLIGRRDPFLPIARLRARGQIHEIRTEDLKFTTAETESFLANVLGEKVDVRVADEWSKGTEGWVTGLRLATLALEGSGGMPEDPFETWRSRHHMTQYLLQEVLARQESAVRVALLRSSIADRFCAPLCTALQSLGEGDSATAMDGLAFIDRLIEVGLFVTAVDAEHTWYRYHHLFRDMLREEAKRRFGSEGLAALHGRASDWYEREGLVDEALHHALAAEDVERAADLVEMNQRAIMVKEDRWYVLDGWLSMLPESVVQERLELLRAQSWLCYFKFQIAAIPPILDRIEDLLNGNVPQDLCGELAFFRGLCLYFQNEGARALECLEEALAGDLPTDHMFRSKAEIVFGLAGQMEGQLERVTRALGEWLDDDSAQDVHRSTHLLSALVHVNVISGDLEEAKRYAERFGEAGSRSSYGYALDWSDYQRGIIHLYRCELALAIPFLRRVTEHRYQHHQRAAIDAMAALSFAQQAQGKPEAAAGTLRLLREFAAPADSAALLLADSCEARLSIMQGRPEAAVRWLRLSSPPDEKVMIWWFEVPCVTRCRTLIAEGSAASLTEAEQLLQEYAELNEANHNICQLIGVLALQAVASGTQGKTAEAVSLVERALELAKPGGFVFRFVELGEPMADLLRRQLEERTGHADFIKQILKTFYEVRTERVFGDARGAVASPAPAPDLLTAREFEVLELLGRGLHRENIADRLFVSDETVKTHLKHIYRKLRVSDRKHAVEEARARNLIAPH